MKLLTYTRIQLRKMTAKQYEKAIKVYMKETGKFPPSRRCRSCGERTPKDCVCAQNRR